MVSNSPFESASHRCSPRGTILKYPSDAFDGSNDKWKPNCFSESSKALEPGSSLAWLPGCPLLLLPVASSSPKSLNCSSRVEVEESRVCTAWQPDGLQGLSSPMLTGAGWTQPAIPRITASPFPAIIPPSLTLGSLLWLCLYSKHTSEKEEPSRGCWPFHLVVAEAKQGWAWSLDATVSSPGSWGALRQLGLWHTSPSPLLGHLPPWDDAGALSVLGKVQSWATKLETHLHLYL